MEKNFVFTFEEPSSFFLYLFAIWLHSHPTICCCVMIHWGSAVALVATQLVVLWSFNIPEQQRVDHGGV